MCSSRIWSLIWAAALLVLALGGGTPALAAPPDQSKFGIPPGREQAIRDLLAPVSEPDGLRLRGPSIERDRIKWWLMRGEQARAMLVLVPRPSGQPDDPRSKSFAIQIAWAPDVDPEPDERALLQAAVEAVQAEDKGGFYVLLLDVMIANEKRGAPAGPDRSLSADPQRVRLLWSLKIAAIALLIGLALLVTLRPLRDPNPASRQG